MSSESKSEILIAREILDYFQKHPNAADSADGIYRWWLVQSRLTISLPQVEAALRYLCRHGEVVETLRQPGISIYSRAEPIPDTQTKKSE